jgi:hypothetical protein
LLEKLCGTGRAVHCGKSCRPLVIHHGCPGAERRTLVKVRLTIISFLFAATACDPLPEEEAPAASPQQRGGET